MSNLLNHGEKANQDTLKDTIGAVRRAETAEEILGAVLGERFDPSEIERRDLNRFVNDEGFHPLKEILFTFDTEFGPHLGNTAGDRIAVEWIILDEWPDLIKDFVGAQAQYEIVTRFDERRHSDIRKSKSEFHEELGKSINLRDSIWNRIRTLQFCGNIFFNIVQNGLNQERKQWINQIARIINLEHGYRGGSAVGTDIAIQAVGGITQMTRLRDNIFYEYLGEDVLEEAQALAQELRLKQTENK